jgi:hypothetical protein
LRCACERKTCNTSCGTRSGRGLLDILVDFEGTRFGFSFILDTPSCFAISFFPVSSRIETLQANVSPYRGSGVIALPFSLRNLDLVTCSSFAMLLESMVTTLYEQTSRPAVVLSVIVLMLSRGLAQGCCLLHCRERCGYFYVIGQLAEKATPTF